MKLLSNNETETRDIGRRLGEKLKRGDTVCLFGDLGTGKTTMVKGIASVFGINERDITSASYTIIAEYNASVPFYHIDLYRLNPGDAAGLGLEDYLGGDGISVIEWAERAADEIPENSFSVHLRHIENDLREIEIEGIDL